MKSLEVEQRQVVVIGAGPSGAIAAALLNRNGHDVLVLERQRFPRFSIGESLLSHCLDFVEEAGMLDAVRAQVCPPGSPLPSSRELARELAVPYATLAVVANHAAGKGDSLQGISLEAISATLDQTMARVHRILGEFVRVAAREQ